MKLPLASLLLFASSALSLHAQPVLERSWTRLWGSAGHDYAYGVAMLHATNLLVGGYTQGTFDGHPEHASMRSSLSLLWPGGERVWTRLWQGTNDNEASCVGVDPAGSIYLAGHTHGSIGGEPALGVTDFFLSKGTADPARPPLWTRIWGSDSIDGASGLAIDRANCVYVVGYAYASVDGQPHAGGHDLCLTKFAPDGTRVWCRLWGSKNTDMAQGVACDGSNYVYVVGFTEGSFDSAVNHGQRDICLSRFSPEGVREWTRIFGSPQRDEGYAVAVDPQGRVFATGFSGNFDGQVGVGSTSVFITCYDGAGERQWTRLVRAFGGGVAHAVAPAGTNEVYVAGHTGLNPLYGGPQPLHLTTYVQGVQFLTQFTVDGTERWTRCWGSTNSSARSLAVAPDGTLYTAGFTVGGYDGQPGAGENDLCLSRWAPAEPPQFLTLPGVTNLTPTGAGLAWRTDVSCLGCVYYGRFADAWEAAVTNAQASTDVRVNLSNLVAGSTYRYQVGCWDSRGRALRSREAWFTTPLEVSPPGVAHLAVLGSGYPLVLAPSITGSVDRVEFTLDGMVLATVYSPPFNWPFSPGLLDLDIAALAGPHTLAARAYSSADGPASTCTIHAEWLTDGLSTQTRIVEPGDGLEVPIDGFVAPPQDLPLEVYAARPTRLAESTPGRTRPPASGSGSGPRNDWAPVNPVEFYIDGALVHVSTNGITGRELYHEFNLNLGGLSLGEHRFQARTLAPAGYHNSSDSRRWSIVQRRLGVRVSRAVQRNGAGFHVTLAITNTSTVRIRLTRLLETLQGFQACNVQASLSLSNTALAHVIAEHGGRVDLQFRQGQWVVPGGATTVEYDAVPILFTGTCTYAFGGGGQVEFEDDLGRPEVVLLEEVTAVEGPPTRRIRLDEAVQAALAAADYVAVTSPLNLRQALLPDGANTVLTRMAELARLRNGVLGYHAPYGVLLTSFHSGDDLAVGHTFQDYDTRDQVFLADFDADCVRGYDATHQLFIGTDAQLPIHIDLRAGDALAVGNVLVTDATGTNSHRRAEVLVAWGDGHPASERGRITLNQFDYEAGSDHFRPTTFPSTFASGDALAAFRVVQPGSDTLHPGIAVVKTNGQLTVYTPEGMRFCESSLSYRSGDLFAAGNLHEDATPELVVGRLAADELQVYLGRWDAATGRVFAYDAWQTVARVLDAGDSLAVGDVTGSALAEIAVADASADVIDFYAFDAGLGRFTGVGRLDFPFEPGDRLAIARMLGGDKAQVLIARGTSHGGDHAGDIALVNYQRGQVPGDRYALDALLDDGGDWARQLAPTWATNGFLLLVGETEVVPAFRAEWDLLWNPSSGEADFTDRNYASTDSTRENHRPELSVGRLSGNGLNPLLTALDTSLNIALGRVLLNNSHAYVATGESRASPDDLFGNDFVTSAEAVAEELRGRGFETQVHHTPSEDEFFREGLDRDVIFLAGHGTPWSWDMINTEHLLTRRLRGAPVIYAASCLTGRYPEGWSLGEALLERGASAYIGATEVSFGAPGGWGWCPRLAQAFVRRLDRDHTIGSALRDAKRSRLRDAASPHAGDRNYNRYTCAIFHLFGDPKLEIAWAGALRPAGGAARMGGPDPAEATAIGPLSYIHLLVPDYRVSTSNGIDVLEIPGHDQLLVPGQPAVPVYTAAVRFPAHTVVQDVARVRRGVARSVTGLRLPPVVPQREGPGEGGKPSDLGPAWWPDLEFSWGVTQEPDGASTLLIRVYPFYYNTNRTEALFYPDYTFNIQYADSPVRVARLATQQPVYAPGACVTAELHLCSTNAAPLDLLVEPTLISEATERRQSLPIRALRRVPRWAHCELALESAGLAPGAYRLSVEVRNTAGQVLARDAAVFELQPPFRGRILRFAAQPAGFQRGDDVQLAAVFENTGSAPLTGEVVLSIRDAAGAVVQEYRDAFARLAPGATHTIERVWLNAGLVPRNCWIVAFAWHEGGMTDLWVGHDWALAPLRLDEPGYSAQGLLLRWPSVQGRVYTLESRGSLGSGGFSCLASNLPATPPQNVFLAPTPGAQQFYRVVETFAP